MQPPLGNYSLRTRIVEASLLSPLPFPYTRFFHCQVLTDEVADTYPRGRGQRYVRSIAGICMLERSMGMCTVPRARIAATVRLRCQPLFPCYLHSSTSSVLHISICSNSQQIQKNEIVCLFVTHTCCIPSLIFCFIEPIRVSGPPPLPIHHATHWRDKVILSNIKMGVRSSEDRQESVSFSGLPSRR